MHVRKFIVAGLVLALSSVSALAADMSSPKATLKGFMGAIKAGNTQQAKTFIVDQPADQKAADMVLGMIVPVVQLNQAMQDKYGEGLGDNAGGMNAEMFDESFAENAQVNIEGDTATVTPEEGSEMKLKKVDGNWKITMAEDMPSEEELAMFEKVTKAMGNAANQVTQGVKQDQYASAEEASQAFQQQMQQVMIMLMMEQQQQQQGGMQGGMEEPAEPAEPMQPQGGDGQ